MTALLPVWWVIAALRRLRTPNSEIEAKLLSPFQPQSSVDSSDCVKYLHARVAGWPARVATSSAPSEFTNSELTAPPAGASVCLRISFSPEHMHPDFLSSMASWWITKTVSSSKAPNLGPAGLSV